MASILHTCYTYPIDVNSLGRNCCALRLQYSVTSRLFCYVSYVDVRLTFVSINIYFRRYFQIHFLCLKLLCLYSNSTGICSQWSIKQYGNIGLDKCLPPNRQQAIVWSGDGIFSWRTYHVRHLISMSWLTKLAVSNKGVHNNKKFISRNRFRYFLTVII